MLEKQLSAILAQQLRAFIQNVNEEQLRLSLWSGDLVLHNLTLRPDVLDQVIKLVIANAEVDEGGSESAAAAAKALLLPFTVVEGVVSTLKISVPWTALLGEPVSVELDGVELVLGPLRTRPYSDDEETSRSGAIQSKQLQQFDRYRAATNSKRDVTSTSGLSHAQVAPLSTPPTNPQTSSSSSSAASLITTIARNAHIVIRNVACKYLNDYADLHASLASMLEILIEEIFVSTTDDEWRARFVSDASMPICKQISLEGLVVKLYHDKVDKKNDDSGDAKPSWKCCTTLLRGGDATIRVKAPAPQPPPSTPGSSPPPAVTDILAQLNPMHMVVTFDAVKHLCAIAESLSPRYVDCSEYRRFLFTLSPATGRGSKALRRWKFALLAVTHHLGTRRRTLQSDEAVAGRALTQWEQMKTFCDLRREYVSLHKRAQSVRWLPALNAVDAARVDSIESLLRVDQIVFLRCLSHAELAYEREVDERQRGLISSVEHKKPQPAGSRWTSWLYRGAQPASPIEAPSPPILAIGTAGANFSAAEERAFIAQAFEQEWSTAVEYLFRKGRPQTSGGAGAAPAVAAAAATAAAEAAASASSLMRLHCELSLCTLRVLPHLAVDAAQQADSRYFHLSMLQGLQQSILVQIGDMQADVNFGSKNVRHVMSSEIGFCKVFLESTWKEEDTAEHFDASESDAPPPLWSICILDSRALDPASSFEESTPLTSSFMTVGLTTDNHLEVLVQPFTVRLPLFDETAWWACAAQALMLEILRLPVSSSTSLRNVVHTSDAEPATMASAPATMKLSIVLRQVALGIVLDVPSAASSQSSPPQLACTLSKLDVSVNELGALVVMLASLEVEAASTSDGDSERVCLLRTQSWRCEVDASGSTVVSHPEEIEGWLHPHLIAPLGDAIRGVTTLAACRCRRLQSNSRGAQDDERSDELSPAVATLLATTCPGVTWFDSSACTLVLGRSGTQATASSLRSEWTSYWDLRALLSIAARRLAPSPVAPVLPPRPKQGSPAATSLTVAFGSLRLKVPTSPMLRTDTTLDIDDYAEMLMTPSIRAQTQHVPATDVSASEGGPLMITLRIASCQTDTIDSSSVEVRNVAFDLSHSGRSFVYFPSADFKLDTRASTSAEGLRTSTTIDIRVREMSDIVITSALVGCVETVQAVAMTLTSQLIPSAPCAHTPVNNAASSSDLAVKCSFDEGMRIEMFETLSTTAEDSQTLEDLVDHLYSEKTPVAKERPWFIFDIERISASVVSTEAESRISVDGAIGSLQHVNPLVDGDLFPVLGFGTSKCHFSPQTFEVKLVIPTTVTPTNDDSTAKPSVVAPPAMIVSALLKGGKLCYNHPFFMKLSQGIVSDPIVTRLSGMSLLPSSTRGLTLHAAWVDSTLARWSAPTPSAAVSAAPWTQLDVRVEALELLCATDAACTVAEDSPESFVRFVVQEVSVGSKMLIHNRRHPFLRTSVSVRGLQAEREVDSWRAFASDGTKDGLYEMIGDVEIQISTNLLCLFEPTSQQYQYQYTPSADNSTTLITLSRQKETSSSPPSSASKPAVEMCLSLAQYTSLMSVLFRNVLSPLVPPLPAPIGPSPPLAVLMLNAPSLCCRLMVSERCVFAFKLQEGMRFYQVSGGSLNATQMALDVSGVVVEDCSPSVIDVDRTVPKESQLKMLIPSLGSSKIMHSKRVSLRMRQEDEGAFKIAVTDVEIDTVVVNPLVRPIFTLYDGLMNPTVAELMTSAPTEMPRRDVEQSTPTLTSRTSVDVRGCAIHFDEPWGEALAELRLDLTKFQLLAFSDLSQRMTIEVAEPLTLRHMMFDEGAAALEDVPYRYHCLVSSATHQTSTEHKQRSPAPVMSMTMTVPPPAHPPVKHLAGVLLSEQPQPQDFGDMVIHVRNLSIVGLAYPWLRLLQYVNGEFMEIANLTYTPQQRAAFGTVPYFAFSGMSIDVENTTIVVPCSVKPSSTDDISAARPQKQQANLTDLDYFEVCIRQATVKNSFFWSESVVDLSGSMAASSTSPFAPHRTYASGQEYHVSVNDVTVWHSHHRQPNHLPLLSADIIELTSPMVFPTDTVAVIEDATSATCKWRILPVDELRGALFRQVLSIEARRLNISLHPLLVPCILRCLDTTSRDMALMPAADKYYSIVTVTPYKLQQDVKVRATDTTVALVEQLPQGEFVASTSTASHFQHQQREPHAYFLSVHISEVVAELLVRGDVSTNTLTVPGMLIVTEQGGQTIMCRGPTCDSTEETLPTVCVMIETTSSAVSPTNQPQASALRKTTVETAPFVTTQRIIVETNFVWVTAQLATVDTVLRLQDFVAQLPMPDGGSNQQQQPAPAITSQSSSTLAVRCHRTAVQLANAAVLHVKTVALTPNDPATSSGQLQVVSLESITLTRPQSTVSFVEVGAAEVKIGTGDLQIRIQRTHIYNYSSAFFIGIIETANSLQDHLHINTKLPVEQDEGYRQTLLISLRDSKLSLFPGGAETPKAARLDFVFPGFVVRSVQTTASSETSVDSEDGSIVYEHPHASVSSLQICKGMALSFQLSSNELQATSSTNVKIGPISIVLPIGSVLQNFVEVVATSMVPFSKVVLFPAQSVDAPTPVAPRRRTHLSDSTASQLISLTAPMLSVHVCDATTAAPATSLNNATGPRTLFGVDVHQVHVVHRITSSIDKVELSIFEVTSIVDKSIQNMLLSASPMLLDDELSPAILVRREVTSSLESSNPLLKADETESVSKAHDSTTRCKQEKIVARLHMLDATISPSLLTMINENILERVAIATKRVKEQRAASQAATEKNTHPATSNASNASPTPKRHHHPLSSTASRHSAVSSGHSRPGSGPSRAGGASHSQHLPSNANILTVTTNEYFVKQDIVLGGRHGSILHFSKSGTLASSNASPCNTIHFSAPVGGVATVYLSYVEGVDGQMYFPIVVDPGLSVITEGIRFVLPPHGAASQALLDFAHVGERSYFQCDATMVIRASTATKHAQLPTSSSLFHPTRTAATSSIRYVKTVEILASVALRCWSFHQSVAVTTEIRGQYRSEAMRRDDLASTERHLLDEQGDLSISNLSIVSDAGNITSQPTGVVLNVGYFKPSSEDDVKLNCSRTVVRAIIPASTFMISIGHAKLMYDIVGALQRGSEHIGSIEFVGDAAHTDDGEDDERTPSVGTAYENSEPPSPRRRIATTTTAVKRIFFPLPHHATQRALRRGAEIPSPRVEFGLTAPQLCMVLTDDFFHPIVVVSIDNVAVQGHTTRAVSDVTLSLSLELTVRDYPEVPLPLSMSPDGSRLLLSTAPELAVEYTTINCGVSKELGHALQVAGAAARFDATIPVNSLQKMFAYRFAEQKTGAHSFLNNVGVPLLLMSADVHHSAASSLCELPMDVVVKADIFRYDQTLFRVLQTTPYAVRQDGGHPSSQLPQGQTVDLRWLHSGASVGLTFLATAYQHPLCEVIMRLDSLERKVTFSSTVTFVNKLSDCTIILPSPEEHFTVDPSGGSIPAPIPVLQHVMQLCVSKTSTAAPPTVWSLLDSVAATSFCQWDALLGAFCAALDEDLSEADDLDGSVASSKTNLLSMKSTASFENGILSIPLTLRLVSSAEETVSTTETSPAPSNPPTETDLASSGGLATRCILLQIHRQPIAQYVDASFAGGIVNPTKMSTKFELLVTVSPVTRFVNAVGMDIVVRLTSSSRAAKVVEGVTIDAESGADWFDPIDFSAESPTTVELTILGTTLRSARPCALPEVPGMDKWITVVDESSNRQEHLRVHRDPLTGYFHISAAAVVENRTRFAVELNYGATGGLVAGQVEQRGMDAKGDCGTASLLIGYPRTKLEPVALRARVSRQGATPSQPFQATSLLPSSLLSCGEGHLLHVFSARREVMTPAPTNGGVLSIPALLQCPRIILEPTWWIENQHSVCLLLVKAVGLDDHIASVSPGESFPLTTFHTKCGADPEIQVCYSTDGQQTFEWSPPLPLATLTSVGTCRTIRHNFRGDADLLIPALGMTPVFSNKCASVSGEEQLFTCMKIVTKKSSSGSVHVSCQLANPELLIENRTNCAVTFTTSPKGLKSSPPSEQFVVSHYSDAAAAWVGSNPTEALSLHLQATTSKGKKFTVTIDLMAQSTMRDAVQLSAEGLWVLTTYNTARHMYYVAIVSSRMLEGALVPQPRSMMNTEFFCRHIDIHVAACLVHGSELTHVHRQKPLSLDQLPIAASARRKTLWCCAQDVMNDDDTTITAARRRQHGRDARILNMLSRVELDVLRLTIESVYINACSNGAHQFGEFSMQSLVVQDCSVEAPHFPTVVSIAGKHLRTSSQPQLYHSVDEQPQPAITVRAHFGEASVISSASHHQANTQTVTATSIQKLHLHVEPVVVQLADAFLFALRRVATTAALQLAALAKLNTSSSASSTNVVNAISTDQHTWTQTAASVRCRIERLAIDALQVQFTLHRRGDGRFNPLDGLPIGFLVPSIEEAPINLGDLVLADVLQTGSSTTECVVNCVVPYFRSRAILQAFKILGSMELIGNPMMFASNVSSGVRSFVKDTVDLHPWQGTKTLFASTTSSALHSLALLSKVGGRATATLSRDTEWLSARETSEQSSQRNRGLLMGFASGVVSGVAGVVRDPVRGLKANGATGFCGGLLTGVVGVVSRPVSGMLDGLSNTAEDLSSSMKPAFGQGNAALAISRGDNSNNNNASPIETNRNFRLQAGSISSDLDEVESVVSSVSKTATPSQSPRSSGAGGPAHPSLTSVAALNARTGLFIPRSRFIQIACASATTSPTEKERWRSLFQTLGTYNVARHAPWKEFLKYATAEELTDAIHLAFEGLLTKHLIELRSGKALTAVSSPLAPPRDRRAGEDEGIERMYRVRALNIKTTLGPADAMKFVRAEQFVAIANLSEIKLAVSPGELQRKFAPVLKDHAEEIAAKLLRASWL